MEKLALIISGAAFLVAFGHLLWNVFVWHAAGPRVETEVHQAPFESEHVRIELMGMLVRNAGRSAVDVIAAGLLSETDQWVELPDKPDLPAPQLPYRLQPGEQIDWSLRFVDPLRDRLASQGYAGTVRLRGFVNLGNGKRVISRQRLLVAVPADAT